MGCSRAKKEDTRRRANWGQLRHQLQYRQFPRLLGPRFSHFASKLNWTQSVLSTWLLAAVCPYSSCHTRASRGYWLGPVTHQVSGLLVSSSVQPTLVTFRAPSCFDLLWCPRHATFAGTYSLIDDMQLTCLIPTALAFCYAPSSRHANSWPWPVYATTSRARTSSTSGGLSRCSP
jgi:hypothetical protein